MHNQLLKITAVLLLCMLGTSCVHYKSIMTPTRVDPMYSGKMEILLLDGTTYRLEEASVGMDRIVGWGNKFLPDHTAEEFSGSIPFRDIQIVKTDNVDPLASILTVGAIGFLVYGTLSESVGGENSPITIDITYPSSGGGSCPYVFTFDGENYHFESETFAGAVCPALERKVVDALHYLKPVNGSYCLAVADNSPESQHINEISLFAVRHPKGTAVLPDASGMIHSISQFEPPMRAESLDGSDVTRKLISVDRDCWRSDSSSLSGSTSFRLRDGVICQFANRGRSGHAKLIFTGRNTSLGYFALETLFASRGPAKLGWYHKLFSDSLESAKLKRWMRQNGGLHIYTKRESNWNFKSWLPDVGPQAFAERVISIDLGDNPDTVLVIKLESTTDLWEIDCLAVDYSDDEIVSEMPLALKEALYDDGRDVTKEIETRDSEYVALLPERYSLLRFSQPDTASLGGDTTSIMLQTSGFYYSWTTEEITDQSALSDAMLADAPLAYQAFLALWLARRHQWEDLYKNEPQFVAGRMEGSLGMDRARR